MAKDREEDGELYYIRRRGQLKSKYIYSYNPQKGIKRMCTPNEYGVPDMLFRYQEFYDHYIKEKENNE